MRPTLGTTTALRVDPVVDFWLVPSPWVGESVGSRAGWCRHRGGGDGLSSVLRRVVTRTKIQVTCTVGRSVYP